MARGILFTGKDAGGIVQIENLSPVVTVTKNGSGQLTQIQITIAVTAGQEVANQPAMLANTQAFIPLKGLGNQLDLELNKGTISFQEDILNPGHPNLAFGAKGNGGKVGGPGLFLFRVSSKKKSPKKAAKKKK